MPIRRTRSAPDPLDDISFRSRSPRARDLSRLPIRRPRYDEEDDGEKIVIEDDPVEEEIDL